jgi:hypothetical protein
MVSSNDLEPKNRFVYYCHLICSYGILSLTRGRVSFTIAAGLASAVILGLVTTVYCLRFETTQTRRARSTIYISQGTGGPVMSPTLGSFFVVCCTVAYFAVVA